MTEAIVLTGYGKQVTIFTTRIEEVRNKKLNTLATGQGSALWGSPPPPTRSSDRQQVEIRWAVDGYIEESFGDGDTSATAIGKRSDLFVIQTYGGVINMSYQGSVYKINIDKLSVIEEPGSYTSSSASSQYIVKFTAVEGINMGSAS